VSFAQATTVQLDALALTVFDAAHGQDEERWLMPGTASDGKLLASRRCCSHGHEGHVGTWVLATDWVIAEEMLAA
jgi:hypothetical protein